MEIIALKEKEFTEENSKLEKVFFEFNRLIMALKKRNLPEHLVEEINQLINEVDVLSVQEARELKKLIKGQQAKILKLLEKELQLVPKGYHSSKWMVLGMTAFGVLFGMSLGNLAYLGIGLPIGMAIGLAFGNGLDKKAFEEGNQLDFKSTSV